VLALGPVTTRDKGISRDALVLQERRSVSINQSNPSRFRWSRLLP